MPELDLTIDQVIEIVGRLSPEEKAQVLRRLQGVASATESREEWLIRLRALRDRLKGTPSLSQAIIEDREDRF